MIQARLALHQHIALWSIASRKLVRGAAQQNIGAIRKYSPRSRLCCISILAELADDCVHALARAGRDRQHRCLQCV